MEAWQGCFVEKAQVEGMSSPCPWAMIRRVLGNHGGFWTAGGQLRLHFRDKGRQAWEGERRPVQLLALGAGRQQDEPELSSHSPVAGPMASFWGPGPSQVTRPCACLRSRGRGRD